MFGRIRAALARAILHILVTFFIAFIIVGALVLGVGFLISGSIGAGWIVTAIVAGLIIGIIAGFIALLVEAVRGVEAGVHEVEEGVGHVIQGAADSVMHHEEPGH